MPRPRRSNSSRYSRNSGIVSGVTFYTNPSGVTIYEDNVEAGTVKSNALDNLTTTGYVLPYGTAADLKMVTGILSCAGTSLSRQNLGLTTINHVQAVAAFNRAAVSACAIVVVKPKTSAWASGVTHVDFYAYATPQGGAFGTAVSILYTAVGS